MKKIILILLLLLAVAAFAGQRHFDNKAADEADKVIAAYNQYADIDYGSVSAGLLDQSISIKDISLTPKGRNKNRTYRIGKLKIKNADTEPKVIPSFMNISLSEVVLNVDELGDQGKTFTELGYQQLQLDLDIDYQYNAESKQLEAKLDLDIDDAAQINTNFKLGNLDLTTVNWFYLLLTYSTITIHSVEIEYLDDSLALRSNQAAAKKQGISIEQVKQQQLDQLSKDIENASDPLSKQVYSAIYKFIENPNQIKATVMPDQPVSLGELFNTRNQARLIKRLGLKISS